MISQVRFRNYRKINCMNDSRDFQDAESVRNGHSHVTSQPVSFPPHPVRGGMLSRSIGMPSRKDGPPSIWDTHGIYRRTNSHVYCREKRKTRTKSRSEMPVWTVSKRFSHLQWRRPIQRIMVQANNDCRFRIFILTNSLRQLRFACWKIRFKTEVCTCSQFPTEAMQWIKEVELVNSVDDLRSSSSSRGISMPNFEVLDARIASALNKIIHNSQFKRRVSLEEQGPERGPFPSRQTDCLLDLRTIPGHWYR